MIFGKSVVRYHHSQVHENNHIYECNHSYGNTIENKDEKTLNILLVHWIKHSQSHEEGYREWIEKARNIGKYETASRIEKAIEYLQKANEMLKEAKKHM